MARVFALLAIGVPLFIFVVLTVFARTSGSDGGLATLAVVLIAFVFMLFAVLIFGALAIITARPRDASWRLARRISLGLIGLIFSFYGFKALLTINDEPTVFVVLALGVLLLPLGIGALLVLWHDVCLRDSDLESDQP